MLKDRRVLLERELEMARKEAGKMYLDIVTHDGDVHSLAYISLKDKVTSLQFDLSVVSKLIDEGHP